MKLAAGSYFVGFDRPMLASDDMLRAGLAGLGLELVRIVARTASAPPVDPRKDPAFSDAWDYWLELRAPRELELERPERVRWIVAAPSSSSSAPPAPSSTPAQQVPSSPATSAQPASSAPVARGASSGAAVLLVLLVLASERRRRYA